MPFLVLIAGLVLLVVAGEFLVRGATGIALKASIPPVIVGLTVVSIGTSAPELFASLNAAFSGKDGLAIGNVIGSNIANLGLVLSITAIIFPIAINKDLLKLDWPVMMGASLLFLYFISDLQVQQYEGIIFVVLLIAYIAALIVKTRKSKKAQTEAVDEELVEFQTKGYPVLFLLILGGCVGLYFGAEWFVQGASDIARKFDVSETVIGLTVVAFGTSVPELVASGVAAFKKETDISIGNLIGSNIFNLLAVMGITSSVKPLAVNSNVLKEDIWWMLAFAAVLLPLMILGKTKIGRIKGVLLLIAYVLYIYIALS
ncbi:MAG: calcium/sodium antiporter [Flavobacteriales bacterium]|nr:calcium/sodium antiporter [Flavobacteriales bacterium]